MAKHITTKDLKRIKSGVKVHQVQLRRLNEPGHPRWLVSVVSWTPRGRVSQIRKEILGLNVDREYAAQTIKFFKNGVVTDSGLFFRRRKDADALALVLMEEEFPSQ